MATNKVQTGIRLEDIALEKIKYVAKTQKRTLNSLVEYLVSCEIEKFEKEHGTIPVESHE